MIKREKCFILDTEIVSTTILTEHKLALLTKTDEVKIFSLSNCFSVQNFSFTELNSKVTATAFNENASLLAVTDKRTISIVDTSIKCSIGTIHTSEGEITQLMFLPNSKYLVVGFAEGNIVQYRYDAQVKISRLCSFVYKKNHTSLFSFKEGFLASSSDRGEILIFKTNSYTHKKIIKTKCTKIVSLVFLNASEIVTASRDGRIAIHTLRDKQKPRYVDSPFTKLHNLVLVPQTEYAIVCGNSKNIALVDLKKARILRANFISFKKEVSQISLTNDAQIIVTLEAKEIEKITLPSSKDLTQDILHNSLYAAFVKVETNPALRGTKEYKQLQTLYEKLYLQVVEALCRHRTKEAHRVLKEFSTLKEKKADINTLFQSFKHYKHLITLVDEKKYLLAYGLVEKYPALKETKQYEEMQEQFQKAYTLAEIAMKIGREDLAKNTLSPYIAVLVKRPIIQELLQNKKREKKAKKGNDTEKKELDSLNKYYQEDDFIHCYELLDKYQYLQQYELAKLLEKHWDKVINSCENVALKGDIKGVIEILGEFIDIATRVAKIEDLLQLAHHIKIKAYITRGESENAEYLLYKYLDIFGQNSEILLIMQDFESKFKKKLAITADIKSDHKQITLLASYQ